MRFIPSAAAGDHSSRRALKGFIGGVVGNQLVTEHPRFLARRFRRESAQKRQQGSRVDVHRRSV